MKVMEGGEIAQSGKYEALLEEGRGFKQLVDAHEDAMGGVHQQDEEEHYVKEELRIEAKLSKSGILLSGSLCKLKLPENKNELTNHINSKLTIESKL